MYSAEGQDSQMSDLNLSDSLVSMLGSLLHYPFLFSASSHPSLLQAATTGCELRIISPLVNFCGKHTTLSTSLAHGKTGCVKRDRKEIFPSLSTLLLTEGKKMMIGNTMRTSLQNQDVYTTDSYMRRQREGRLSQCGGAWKMVKIKEKENSV